MTGTNITKGIITQQAIQAITRHTALKTDTPGMIKEVTMDNPMEETTDPTITNQINPQMA